MEITVQDDIDPCKITITGEIDLDKSSEVRAKIMEHLDAGVIESLNVINITKIRAISINTYNLLSNLIVSCLSVIIYKVHFKLFEVL